MAGKNYESENWHETSGLPMVSIRLIEEPPIYSKHRLSTPDQAIAAVEDMLKDVDRECFVVVNLKNNMEPINCNIVSMGTLSEALIHPREVFKTSILSNASAIICAHNHVSHNLEPSKEDYAITERLQQAGALLGIHVLDHLIIGGQGRYYSFHEHGEISAKDYELSVAERRGIDLPNKATSTFTRTESGINGTLQASSMKEKLVPYGASDSMDNLGHLTTEATGETKQETQEVKINYRKQRVQEITDKLQKGMEELFDSQRFKDYLDCLSKFHQYSFNNTLLISMQLERIPGATGLCHGYKAWQTDFGRHVKKGEKGIQILAPAPYKIQRSQGKVDPVTGNTIIGGNGKPITENVEVTIPAFKPITIFDAAQTEGEPLPLLGTEELDAKVCGYDTFIDAIERISPIPIRFEAITDGSKGYYHTVMDKIVINTGMSEAQTVKTALHELAHAVNHNKQQVETDLQNGIVKDRATKECEAEAIAYTVCTHFGIDTSEYSFDYLAGWSSNKEMPELKAVMDNIRLQSSNLIRQMEDVLQTIMKEKNMMVGQEQTPTSEQKKEPYNHLRQVEELEEEGYDFIDGIVNNPKRDLQKDNAATSERQKAEKGKASLAERLKEKKEEVDRKGKNGQVVERNVGLEQGLE